jgi:hypothetical protein
MLVLGFPAFDCPVVASASLIVIVATSRAGMG